MLESGVTSKGQTTLPKPVRDALSVRPGDRVRYLIHDGEVRIVPVRPVSRLFGVLAHDGPAATLDDMERAIGDAASAP
ncbi:MAG: AbrB/MazE/SpoVT family DNA-binding domain-containing protein [Dehalococcoidia bacterium]|nr:AbrB/MazE/SpoVT family DNA-binding domain-containing protein [Dehalococcoidia bacterium]